jgi:hypothetical protein
MEVKIIPGMLNLAKNPMTKRVTKMQQVLGKASIVKISRHAIMHQKREGFESHWLQWKEGIFGLR